MERTQMYTDEWVSKIGQTRSGICTMEYYFFLKRRARDVAQ
jgi:hypothetical protein